MRDVSLYSFTTGDSIIDKGVSKLVTTNNQQPPKMRIPHCHCREPLLLLFVFLPLLLAPTALAYSLADVQKISGFGPACTNAYSTPFKSCTSNDFNGNQGCSTTCASTLAALLANVDEACNGHTASPDTLIGQIFSGEAYDTLCPGSSGSAGSSAGSAGGRGGEGGGGSNNGNGQASAHLSLATNLVASQASTTLAPKVIQSSTSSYGLHSYLTPIAAPSTTPKPSHFSTSTLSTSPSTTFQTSTPTSISTVPLSELTRVTTEPITTTKTAAAATSLSNTSSTTIPETSQGSNPQGAGGGTPFDITSDSCRNERSLLWTMSVVPTAIFVLLWLV